MVWWARGKEMMAPVEEATVRVTTGRSQMGVIWEREWVWSVDLGRWVRECAGREGNAHDVDQAPAAEDRDEDVDPPYDPEKVEESGISYVYQVDRDVDEGGDGHGEAAGVEALGGVTEHEEPCVRGLGVSGGSECREDDKEGEVEGKEGEGRDPDGEGREEDADCAGA
ncbi:hypothetical protein C0989_005908 [Termitomyces sp. Mn162]|nr:hypothetical protein C0989_005908 [Termitomyces sp. Mn162]